MEERRVGGRGGSRAALENNTPKTTRNTRIAHTLATHTCDTYIVHTHDAHTHTVHTPHRTTHPATIINIRFIHTSFLL